MADVWKEFQVGDSPCPSDFLSNLQKYIDGNLPSHFYWEYLLGLFGEEREVEVLLKLNELIVDQKLRSELAMTCLLDAVLMDFGGDEDAVHEFENHVNHFLKGEENAHAFWKFAVDGLERDRVVELLPLMELLTENTPNSFKNSFHDFEGIF